MPDEPIQIDEAGAAAALDGLLAEQEGRAPDEGGPPAPTEPVEQAPPAPVAPPAEPTESAATEEEFIPRADLESLLEGVTDQVARDKIITAYQSFNKGFTQRTQEVAAEKRRLQGIDPEKAQAALQWFDRLNSDRDFALEVHRELSQALEAAGLSPAAASKEATKQVEAATPAGYEEYGLDPDNPLVKDLQDLRQWRAEQEQRESLREQEAAFERQRQDMIADIQNQALALRKDRSHYEDEDMDAIFKIAGSMDADLFAAADYYDALQSRVVTSYAAKKGRAPGGVAPAPAAAPHSEAPPAEFRTTDEAHKLAGDWLKARMGQEG